MKATTKMRTAIALLSSALLLQGCVVGPKYSRPSVDTPGTFKEVTPDDLKKMDGWKVAQPQDSALHGKSVSYTHLAPANAPLIPCWGPTSAVWDGSSNTPA